MTASPKFVLSAGMVGSGSTFLFNVIRELLICERPRSSPLAIYSDAWDERFSGPRSLVVKCHGGSPSLLDACKTVPLRPLVTVRHPGDSVCSDMERFGLPFAEALARVETSLIFALSLRGIAPCMVLRYEDGFASDPGTSIAVAGFLGIAMGMTTASEIFAKYDTAATRRLAEAVATAPDAMSNPANGDVWSTTTQIHRSHIGKLVSGRWRGLPAAERKVIAIRCGTAAWPFGYVFDD